jgi:hypothetical protein
VKHPRDTWYIKLVYDTVLDDYALSDLPAEARWTYLQLYCLVGKFGTDGTWERPASDVAKRLRCDATVLQDLASTGLIEYGPDSVTIVRWEMEQVGQSTRRTQRHRAKVVQLRSGNATGTVPGTDIP